MGGEVLVAALALVLGLLIGLGIGVVRGYRQATRLRSIAGANAALGRMWPEALPTRSAADILAGRIRVVLAGVPYVMPVLPRRASRDWLASLDAEFADLSAALDAAADDKPRILALLAGQTDRLLLLLRSYDQTGVLPAPEFIDDFVTDAEVLVATSEVWQAANPLAATLVATTGEDGTDGTSPEQPSSPPTPTGGDLTMSMGI